MRLSSAIMAHRSRERLAESLAQKLRGAPVVYDEKSDRWETGRRAWLAQADADADYSMVIQDDAAIPRGFIAGVRNALQRVPEDSPLVCYMTRTRQWAPILRTVPADASFVQMKRIWWGVCVIVPTYLIPEMISFCDDLTTDQYDHRLGWFFYELGIPVMYSWPSLVDHHHVPSLIDGRSAKRSAHYYVKGRADRLSWDGLTVKIDPPDSIPEPKR